MMRKVIVAAVLACSQAGLCLGATATTGGTAAATDTNGIVDTNGTADTNGIAGTATATDDTAGTPTTDGTAGTPTTDGTGGTPTNGTGGTPTTGGGPRFPFGRLVPGVDGNGDMDLSALPEGMERVGAAQGVCVAKFGTDDEFSSSSSWQQIVADLFNKTEDLEKSVGTDEKKKQDIDKKLDEALKSPSKDLPKNAKDLTKDQCIKITKALINAVDDVNGSGSGGCGTCVVILLIVGGLVIIAALVVVLLMFCRKSPDGDDHIVGV